ncbi:MAG: glycosyltransferase [Candidatus Andersenbacteria bacterium]|nr:glycosyltransferase [Candidatus Andersenbacteria bacterium]
MNPLVSVVIPVYNAEHFLEQAIESILAQDYAPLEIIAVNDGSTDASADILRTYAEYIRIIDQKNSGVASARNKGFAAARGEYISFLDNDDIFLPRKISAQVEYLEKHPDIHMCVPLCEGFLENGVQKPGWVRDGFLDVMHRNLSPSAWLIRKQLFSYVGAFDPQYSIASDTDWVARVLKAGYEIGTVEQLLWKKRVHQKNASHILSLSERANYNRELLSLIVKKAK